MGVRDRAGARARAGALPLLARRDAPAARGRHGAGGARVGDRMSSVTPNVAPNAAPNASGSAAKPRTLLQDFVMLTKPRIISLLLVTTAAPMFVAGDPSWTTLGLVMLAGYLMAGGANAVNMYL